MFGIAPGRDAKAVPGDLQLLWTPGVTESLKHQGDRTVEGKTLRKQKSEIFFKM